MGEKWPLGGSNASHWCEWHYILLLPTLLFLWRCFQSSTPVLSVVDSVWCENDRVVTAFPVTPSPLSMHLCVCALHQSPLWSHWFMGCLTPCFDSSLNVWVASTQLCLRWFFFFFWETTFNPAVLQPSLWIWLDDYLQIPQMTVPCELAHVTHRRHVCIRTNWRPLMHRNLTWFIF